MNASSSRSEVVSAAAANGPRPWSVCHAAMVHTRAFSAVTSRSLKRRAAQITNGRTANVSGSEDRVAANASLRSEEHTSELQSRLHLVCRLLLEKKKNQRNH